MWPSSNGCKSTKLTHNVGNDSLTPFAMKVVALLLWSWLAATAAGSQSDGSSLVRRRRLASSSSSSSSRVFCRITVERILFENGTSTRHFLCVTDTATEHRVELPGDLISSHHGQLAAMGQLHVELGGTRVHDGQLYYETVTPLDRAPPPPSVIQGPRFLEATTPLPLQSLATPAMGTKTLFVVRVTSADGVHPMRSLDEIYNTLFVSTTGMAAQYARCSANQLQFMYAGGLDVVLPNPMSYYTSPSALVSAASDIVEAIKGVASPSELADKVLFCQPPGTGTWLAVAPVHHWRLNFNDVWCTSLSATMHELGHSLGLLHSGHGSEPYGDKTGYLGYGQVSETSPLKCFNGYKNAQLGWYAGQTTMINPSTTPVLTNLAPFVNYGSTSDPVLLNVGNLYFVQFNRATSFNSETGDAINLVTVTINGGGQSWRVAALNATEQYTAPMNNETLVIRVCETSTTLDTRVVVSVGWNGHACPTVRATSCKARRETCATNAECCSGLMCRRGTCRV